MMHGFGLLMGSILGHPWAKAILMKAQKLVSYFRSSTRPMAHLREIAAALGIRTGFSSSNKTRFTSVHMCVVSVLALKDPLRSMVRQAGRTMLPGWAIALIEDTTREFWEQIELLCSVLAPYSQVIMAVQANSTTLADITRYWIYLARKLKDTWIHPFADRGTVLQSLAQLEKSLLFIDNWRLVKFDSISFCAGEQSSCAIALCHSTSDTLK
jgi:hypothetical protein